jgi:hypothetical protein
VLAGHVFHLSKLTGRGFWVLGSTLALFDPVLTALAIAGAAAGIASWLRRGDGEAGERRRDALVALGYVVPYLAVFGIYDLTFDRFGLPLVPFLAVLAAFGASRVAALLPARARTAPLAAAGFALVLAFPVVLVDKLGRLRGRPDTIEQAARWLERRGVPEGERVLVLQNFDVPTRYSESSLRELRDVQTLYWTRAQRSCGGDGRGLHVVRLPRPEVAEGEEAEPVLADMGWLEENDVGFVVTIQASRGLREPMTLELIRKLRRQGKQAAAFAPAPRDTTRGPREPEIDVGFGVAETGTALQLLSAERAGSQVTIFELGP